MKITARILYSVSVTSESPCIATILFYKGDDDELPIRFSEMFDVKTIATGIDKIAYKATLRNRNWPNLVSAVEAFLSEVRREWSEAITAHSELSNTMPPETTELIYDDSEPAEEPE